MLDRPVDDSIAFYSWVITVILFMKEQRVGGVDNKDTKFWIAENGMIEFQILERAIQ